MKSAYEDLLRGLEDLRHLCINAAEVVTTIEAEKSELEESNEKLKERIHELENEGIELRRAQIIDCVARQSARQAMLP